MNDATDFARNIVASALGLDAANIDSDTRMGDTPQWDSLAHMRLILELEKHLGQPLSPLEMLAIKGFDDVRRHLNYLSAPTT